MSRQSHGLPSQIFQNAVVIVRAFTCPDHFRNRRRGGFRLHADRAADRRGGFAGRGSGFYARSDARGAPEGGYGSEGDSRAACAETDEAALHYDPQHAELDRRCGAPFAGLKARCVALTEATRG